MKTINNLFKERLNYLKNNREDIEAEELDRVAASRGAMLFWMEYNPDYGKKYTKQQLKEIWNKKFKSNLKFYTEHPMEFLMWSLGSPKEIGEYATRATDGYIKEIISDTECQARIHSAIFKSSQEIQEKEKVKGFRRWMTDPKFVDKVKNIL